MKPLFEFNGRNFAYLDEVSELESIGIASNCFVLILNSENEAGIYKTVDLLTSNAAGAIAFAGCWANVHIPKLLKDFDEKWGKVDLLPYLFDGLKLSEAMERARYVLMPNEDKLDSWTSTFVVEIGEPKIGCEGVRRACS